MSTPAEQQRWGDAFRPTNPQSPQVVYGTAGEALVDIRAISFVSDGVASVRFHRTVRQTFDLLGNFGLRVKARQHRRIDDGILQPGKGRHEGR